MKKAKSIIYLLVGVTVLSCSNLDEHISLANNYVSLELHDKAIQCFDKALKIEPNNAILLFERGISKKNIGLIEESILDFNLALAIDSLNTDAYYHKGMAYSGLNEPKNAIICFSKAIKLDPNLSKGFFQRATNYVKLSDWDNAIFDFQKAETSGHPNPEQCKLNQALAFQNKGDFCNSIALLNQVLTNSPKNAIAYFQRARSHYYSGDFFKAAKDHNSAIEFNNSLNKAIDFDIQITDSTSCNNMDHFKGSQSKLIVKAERAFKTKNFQSAIGYYSALINNSQLTHSHFYQRGIAKTMLGLHKTASVDFDFYLSNSKNLQKDISTIAKLKTLNNDFKGAEKLYSDLISSYPENSNFYFERAIVNNLNLDFEKALRDYSKAIILKPSSIKYLKKRAELYNQMGMLKKVQADLNSIKNLMLKI